MVRKRYGDGTPRGDVPAPEVGDFVGAQDVPKELRAIIGRTSLKASLRTKDLSEARTIFHAVMQDFEARIASARKQLKTGEVQLPTIAHFAALA
jgi:hypothetical protein